MKRSDAESTTTTGNEINEAGEPVHFILACIELTFVDNEGNTGITRVNTMMMSPDGQVNVKLLGLAQQAAQIQLRKNLNEDVNVLSAVFLSLTDLGMMTQEEFHQGQQDLPNSGRSDRSMN